MCRVLDAFKTEVLEKSWTKNSNKHNVISKDLNFDFLAVEKEIQGFPG
jgi:hypothetical protein